MVNRIVLPGLEDQSNDTRIPTIVETLLGAIPC